MSHDDARQVLTEAAEAVAGVKAAEYGDPVAMWDRVAAMWSAYLGVTVSRTDALHMMQHVKQVREQGRPKYDNRLDNVGYGGLTNCGQRPVAQVADRPSVCARCDQVLGSVWTYDDAGQAVHRECPGTLVPVETL